MAGGITKEKLDELERVLGKDEAGKIVAQLEDGAKALQELGLKWKEVDTETGRQGDGETKTAPETQSTQPEAQKETPDVIPGLAPVTPQFEIVLGQEVLAQIAGLVQPAVQKEIGAVVFPLAGSLETLRAAVQNIAEQVEKMSRADDEKVAEMVRRLPRATAKAIGSGQVFRPTAQTPTPTPEGEKPDLHSVGLKALGLVEE